MVDTGGTRTCVHLDVSRQFHHCAMDADVFLSELTVYPGMQRHSYKTKMFMHIPTSAWMFISIDDVPSTTATFIQTQGAHLPSHDRLSAFTVYPGGHRHSYEPTVFTQISSHLCLPFLHSFSSGINQNSKIVILSRVWKGEHGIL